MAEPDNGARGSILVVDDDESLRKILKHILEKEGHRIVLAENGAQALERFGDEEFDMVIQDLKMPGMNGLELLAKLKERKPSQQVVVMTGFSTWETGVEAMRLGAYDYIHKPFDNDKVRAMVQRAIAQRRLYDDIEDSKQQEALANLKLIGSTPAMLEILSLLRRIAPTDSTVVIEGESGTGKEVIARLIHYSSLRAQGPFISVNCGAFSETLLESELFGHVKGAFTSAVSDKRGLLELADGGSFFLDELGEMSLQAQVRLLRVLETREFLPVGSTVPVRTDVRIIAATNRDLEELVDRGDFREDLFYRLNVIPIHLPPLRERREDIALLAGHFLALYAKRQNKEVTSISPEAREYLEKADWVGNVRELENAIHRAVTLCQGSTLDLEHVEHSARRRRQVSSAPVQVPDRFPPGGIDLEETLKDVERHLIRGALSETGDNMTAAAELLGISFRSMRYKIKSLGIERKR